MHAVVEMAERFAFYGLGGNLVTYLTEELHESTVSAAKNVNTWLGVTFTFPLIGAFIADSYLGRFYTVIVSAIIYFLVYIYTYNIYISNYYHSYITYSLTLIKEDVDRRAKLNIST